MSFIVQINQSGFPDDGAKTEHLVSKKVIDDTKKHTICCPIIYRHIITSSHCHFRWYNVKTKHSVSKKK